MSYQPIENYGIIGDLHSVALVGMNGSIDWLCFPHFDSPSIFAAILDDHKGGLVSNSLVYRYNVAQSSNGLQGEEGTFNICTFWLVEALARAGRFDQRRLEQARLMFEKMLSYANHLGLYAEAIGHSGEALGNFSQAFTHLSLISAAFNLDRALDERK